MNAAEKKIFITALMDRARDELVEAVDKLPEEWDGIELRALCADYMQNCAHSGLLKGNTKRGSAYLNFRRTTYLF